MENLPVEILENIFSYCTTKDVLCLACCSKQHHSFVKPLLWRSVRILVPDLNSHGPNLTNLKHTISLKILDTYRLHVNMDNMATEEAVHYALAGALGNGLLLAKLLGSCDPLKVFSLTTNLSDVGLEYVLDVLPHIKCLKLICNGRVDGTKVNKLLELEDLSLHNCSFTTADALQVLISGGRLVRLKIDHCALLSSDDVLNCVCKVTSLNRLTIQFPSVEQQIDIKPLCSLTHLTHLSIRARLANDSLKQLCHSLRELKSLDFSGSLFTDDGLSDLECLPRLTHLSLNFCRGITPRCFHYIKNPLPLRCLSFSSDLCQDVNGPLFKPEVARLNSLCTLQKIVVDDAMQCNAMVIINSLCNGEKWTLNYCIMNRTYTFIHN